MKAHHYDVGACSSRPGATDVSERNKGNVCARVGNYSVNGPPTVLLLTLIVPTTRMSVEEYGFKYQRHFRR